MKFKYYLPLRKLTSYKTRKCYQVPNGLYFQTELNRAGKTNTYRIVMLKIIFSNIYLF